MTTLSPSSANIPAGSPVGATAETLAQLAQKRGALMQQLAQTDPEVFLRSVMPADTRAALPQPVQAEVERAVTLAGVVDVTHIDDFSNEDNSRFVYHLRSGGEQLDLFLAGEVPAMTSNTQVNISGFRIGKTVVAAGDTGGLTVVSAPSPVPDSLGTQKTLAILVTAPGQPATPTKAQMNTLIFGDQFQKFYKEQSYGKVNFVGDVTDWISVSASLSDSCVAVGFDTPEIKSYLTSHGVNLGSYRRILFVVDTGPGGGGCANIGESVVVFNGANYTLSEGWVGYSDSDWDRNGMTGFEYVLSHEMGHELGTMHANSWSCSGPSLDTNCVHVEYGNSYDVMGTGVLAAHFNAFYKDYLGWLATSTDKQIITKSGTYKLTPIESASGIRAAIIKNPALLAVNPSAEPTYLEYRRPLGFDKLLPASGTGIDINQPIPQYTPFPRLINANYMTDPQGTPVLLAGGTFSWPSKGISIQSSSASTTPSATWFTVTLTTPTCDRNAPTFVLSYGSLYAATGTSQGMGFNVTDNDGSACSPRAFKLKISISSSAGWSSTVYPANAVTLNPGDNALYSVSYVVPQTASLGKHTFTATLTDTTTGTTSTLKPIVTVVAPPSITNISPTSGRAGSTVTLQGSGFNSVPGSTNQILFQSQQNGKFYYQYLFNVAATSDASMSFAFPTTVVDQSDGGTTISTPLGTYTIQLQRSGDGGVSNVVSFAVSNWNALSNLLRSWAARGATLSATKPPFTVAESTTTAQHYIQQNVVVPSASSWRLTFETLPNGPLARNAIVFLRDTNNVAGTSMRTHCILSGAGQATGSSVGGGTGAKITEATTSRLSDGWYQCALAGTFVAPPTSLSLLVYVASSTASTYAGDGVSGIKVRNISLEDQP